MGYGACNACGCAKHECECKERAESIVVKAAMCDPEFQSLKEDLDDVDELDFDYGPRR